MKNNQEKKGSKLATSKKIQIVFCKKYLGININKNFIETDTMYCILELESKL